MDHGQKSTMTLIQPLVVTCVHETMLCGEDWIKLREPGPKLMPKFCKVKFTPYASSNKLDMIGRTKVTLKKEAGGHIETMVYITRGGHKSLLGLKDSNALCKMKIAKEGDSKKAIGTETVNSLNIQ